MAMIESRYFIKELWDSIKELWKVDDCEKKKVVEMLKELRSLRNYAFPCYHHAIVFYMDETTGSRITPNSMSQILVSDSRAPWVKNILVPRNQHSNLV